MSATGHSVYSALFIPILGQLLKDLRQLCEENKKKTVTAEGREMDTPPPQHAFSVMHFQQQERGNQCPQGSL